MKKIKLLAFTALILVFASCSKDKGSGTLSVRLTDAPADYEEVLIDVQELKINVSDNSNEESGWQNLTLITTGQIDLLELANSNDILLSEEELPAGKISQMRLVLGSNNKIKVAGEYHDLDTPSAQQSGLKFNIHATIEEGVTYRMWLDFDVAKSIVEKGNGSYSLKPTIKVFTEAESGSIKGVVSPVAANQAFIEAIPSSGETTGTYSDSDGKFVLKGLPEGTYTVKITPQSPYLVKQVTNVQVTIGSVKDLGQVAVLQ